jgi:hypothetical protein
MGRVNGKTTTEQERIGLVHAEIEEKSKQRSEIKIRRKILNPARSGGEDKIRGGAAHAGGTGRAD